MSEKDTRNRIEWWKYNNRKKYLSNFITKILKKIMGNASSIES